MAIYNLLYGGGGGFAPNIQPLNVSENGTYTASGSVNGYSPVTVSVAGGADSRFVQLAEGTIISVDDSTMTQIRPHAFDQCQSLAAVNLPNVVSIGAYAFQYCYALADVSIPNAEHMGDSAFAYCRTLSTANFPNVSKIYPNAFYSCSNLTSISFPVASVVGSSAFRACENLTTASFPNVMSLIADNAFRSCFNLVSLYVMGSSVPTLGVNVFTSTPIGGYSESAGQFGSVYVPSSLWSLYIITNNWLSISSRIVSI